MNPEDAKPEDPWASQRRSSHTRSVHPIAVHFRSTLRLLFVRNCTLGGSVIGRGVPRSAPYFHPTLTPPFVITVPWFVPSPPQGSSALWSSRRSPLLRGQRSRLAGALAYLSRRQPVRSLRLPPRRAVLRCGTIFSYFPSHREAPRMPPCFSRGRNRSTQRFAIGDPFFLS